MLTTLAALAIALAVGARADEAATAPQEQLRAVDESLAQVGDLLRAKKLTEAADALTAAKAALEKLSAATLDAASRAGVERLTERFAAAERLVAKAQQPASKPAPAKKPPASPAKSSTKPVKTATAKKPAAKPVGPSFTSDVAPILIARCGGCHIRGARGGLSMATFNDLARGADSGPVIQPGASQASRLVEMLVTGKMPRGGARMTQEEVVAIATWIDAGARFDGADRSARIGQAAKPAAPAPEGLVKATGDERVQFNRDLATALVENCVKCHGGDQPDGQLRFETFAGLLRGGASGKIVEPGKPAESLIIKKLRGTEGDRMPLEKPPLADELIGRFETWIKDGAKFDGADSSQPLTVVVEELLAAKLSHDELAARRLTQAAKTWALALPDEQPGQSQTANFILIGNVSAPRLAELGELAESEQAKIAKWLKLDPKAPLVKGSLVLYLFKRSFDYAEFARMVEEREVPKGAAGHWRAKGLESYACLAVSSEGEAGLPALVAEQVAGAYVQSLGNVPAWFAAGAARSIAVRVEPKSPLVKQWADEAQRTSPPGDYSFLTATNLDAETRSRAYNFVRFLMASQPRFQALLSALRAGTEFAVALEKNYGADAKGLVELWLSRKQAGRG
ncbi:MAG: hypothetical protein HYX69_15655 [Planctomycetia bacterium]|nr:hypothetical protein [Planctomycetia bacterium]